LELTLLTLDYLIIVNLPKKFIISTKLQVFLNELFFNLINLFKETVFVLQSTYGENFFINNNLIP